MNANVSFGTQSKIYFENTLKLASTLVIKSEDSIDGLNELIKLKHGDSAVDPYTPSSWKYYMNVCGMYHPTDTAMEVVSLDTLETIPFTVDALRSHTATKLAYAFGSRYYYSLVERYPDQEQLILGILYPADLETAIAAPYGAILSYPEELIEEQEITLLEELNGWIQTYFVRWNIPAYGVTDSLYPASQHAVFYLNLVPKILNLRAARCKTNEVHSFHIRQYLASHGRLDRYLDFMTLKQALFFYRNIAYIERHGGKKETLQILIDRLLTERYIPIAEYSARLTSDFDDKYYPVVTFRKVSLNTEYNVPERNYFEPHEVLDKERTVTYGNSEYIDSKNDVVLHDFQCSTSSVVQTKVLESSMSDYTDAVPYRLAEILLHHWGYLSSLGYYKVLVHFKDPVSSEVRTMNTDEAFLYYVYVSLQSVGIDIQTVPDYFGIRVSRRIKPTKEKLFSLCNNAFKDLEETAQQLIEDQPNITRCYSLTAFFDLCSRLYQSGLTQWYRVSQTEHMERRANLQNMYCQLYQDLPLVFPESGMAYSEWLAQIGIPDTKYSYEQSQELLTNIFNSATGMDIKPASLIKNIQRAMLDMLTQLSSYSIQIIRDINDDSIRPINWAAIRVGDVKGSNSWVKAINTNVDVMDISGVGFKTVQYEAVTAKMNDVVERRVYSSCQMVAPVDTGYSSETQIERNYSLSLFTLNAEYDDSESERTMGVVGISSYEGLTAEQRTHIPDIYATNQTLGFVPAV